MSDTNGGGKDEARTRPSDAAARTEACALLQEAHTAALGVISPATGHPAVTRIAVLFLPAQGLFSLISDLSHHTAALRADPRCSLLIGEPGSRGDPLNHPRLTLQCAARIVDKAPLREAWLTARPKAKLYFDFGDFNLIRLEIVEGFLNGGFGKAFVLTRDDLLAAP